MPWTSLHPQHKQFYLKSAEVIKLVCCICSKMFYSFVVVVSFVFCRSGQDLSALNGKIHVFTEITT